MGRSKMLQVRERAEKDRFVMLYLRVSTDRQAEEGYSIAIQKERLTAYAHSQLH